MHTILVVYYTVSDLKKTVSNLQTMVVSSHYHHVAKRKWYHQFIKKEFRASSAKAGGEQCNMSTNIHSIGLEHKNSGYKVQPGQPTGD